MYVLKCMSKIRSREEIAKNFREKNYEISLETQNADKYMNDAVDYVNKRIEKEVSEFCENISADLKPYVKDIKCRLLNGDYYSKDFITLEYLSLTDLFSKEQD